MKNNRSKRTKISESNERSSAESATDIRKPQPESAYVNRKNLNKQHLRQKPTEIDRSDEQFVDAPIQEPERGR